MNWWLVSNHLKHGLMTVRSSDEPANGGEHKSMNGHHMSSEHLNSGQHKSKPAIDGDTEPVSTTVLTWMTILSYAIFGVGLSIATIFDGI